MHLLSLIHIFIPDSAKEKPLKGEVVAVGNGTKYEEVVVKNGAAVLYSKYAKVYVSDVDRGTKGTHIVVSRTEPQFVRRDVYKRQMKYNWNNSNN